MNPWIVSIALIFISYALATKPTTPKPASLDQIDIETAEEGVSPGVFFGKPWVKNTKSVWYGDLLSKAIRKKGGKK